MRQSRQHDPGHHVACRDGTDDPGVDFFVEVVPLDPPAVTTVGIRSGDAPSWFVQYQELGRIERIVPWVFALIYAAAMVR